MWSWRSGVVTGLTIMAAVAIAPSAIAQSNNDNSGAYNWSGFSGGLFGSGLGGAGDLASALGNGRPCPAGICYAAANARMHDSAFGGGGGLQFGYNTRSGSVLYGLELDAMAQSLRVSKNRSVFDPNVVAFSGALGSTYNFHDEIESHWMGSLRGRLGTFIGGSLLYITGGLALTTLEYKHSYSDNSALLGLERSSTSKSVLGWTLGAGLEMPLSRTMSLRTEYMFTDFSDMKTPNSNVFPLANPGQALCSSATLNQCFHNRGDLGIHQIRLGLNFKLGNDPAPAPLK